MLKEKGHLKKASQIEFFSTGGPYSMWKDLVSIRDLTSWAREPDPAYTDYITQKTVQEYGNFNLFVKRLEDLENKISELRDKIEEFEKIRVSIESENQQLIIRDIPFKRAKKEIEKYFLIHHGEEIDYERLLFELKIDLQLIIKACQELEEEGKIG